MLISMSMSITKTRNKKLYKWGPYNPAYGRDKSIGMQLMQEEDYQPEELNKVHVP